MNYCTKQSTTPWSPLSFDKFYGIVVFLVFAYGSALVVGLLEKCWRPSPPKSPMVSSIDFWKRKLSGWEAVLATCRKYEIGAMDLRSLAEAMDEPSKKSDRIFEAE